MFFGENVTIVYTSRVDRPDCVLSVFLKFHASGDLPKGRDSTMIRKC